MWREVDNSKFDNARLDLLQSNLWNNSFVSASSSAGERDIYLAGNGIGYGKSAPSVNARGLYRSERSSPVRSLLVPMMNASGAIEPAQLTEVDLVNFGGLERLSSFGEDMSQVVKTARSTTVFLSGRRGAERWSGSGVIVDQADLPVQPELYPEEAHFILTCQHVENDGGKLTVTMPDGKEYFAEVAYAGNASPLMDKLDDVAILVVYPKREYHKARLGFSSDLKQGEPVIISGHPLGLPRHTVTFGRITQPEAETGMIAPGLQTDAAINPGNSGGPMFNMKGEVVGLATYGFAMAENTACAQPIDTLRDTLVEISSHGRKIRGYTGVNLLPFPLSDRYDAGFLESNGFPDDTGAIIDTVDAGSPADLFGMKAGDVVVSLDVYVDGEVVDSVDVDYQNPFESGKMKRMIMDLEPGAEVSYRFYRPSAAGFGAEMEIRIPVEELNVDDYLLREGGAN